MTTEGQTEGKPAEGQAQGNQVVQPAEGGQPIEVELPDGTKVTADELKAGYMKDADYRRKTAELAEERKRIADERERMSRQAPLTPPMRSPLANQPAWGEGTDEEPDPMQVLAQEVVGLKALYARDFLNREIERLSSSKYPDMDKKAVFDACWSNPNAVIDDEAARSHNEVNRRVTERTSQVKPQTVEDFWKANPKAKEEYDRRLIDTYNANKQQQSAPSPGGGSGSAAGGETFHEDEKPADSYRDATKRLKERLKSEGSESF